MKIINVIIFFIILGLSNLLLVPDENNKDCNCPGKKTNFTVTNMSVTDPVSQEKMEKAPEMRRKNFDEIKYDEANRMIGVDSLDRGRIRYEYDDLGYLRTKNFNNIRFEHFTFDMLGRQTMIEYKTKDKTDTVQFKYSTTPASYKLGELTEKIEDIEHSFYKFDGRRLLEEKKAISQKEFVTRYEYNPSGHLAALHYPSGLTVNYEYNDSFEVKAISVSMGEKKTAVWKMEKKEASSAIAFGNGMVTSIVSDPQKPVVFQKTGNIQDLEYVFNDRRLIEKVKDKLDLKNKRDFYYDSEERLLTSYGPWGKVTYGYDSMDNLIYKDDNGKKTTLAYPAKSSRIKEIKEYDMETTPSSNGDSTTSSLANNKIIHYQYDNLGNTIQYGEYKFEYNIRGRLAKIFKNDAFVVELFYNYKGQRVMEKRGGKINYYVYDSKDWVLGRYDENGNALQEYIYENDTPVAFVKNNKIYYYHYDPMNFPIMITDESGKPVRQVQYKPYGEITKEEGKITDSLRYPGQFEIEGTELYYNYMRTYLCKFGKYIEIDNINFFENCYSYSQGNPISFFDLIGQKSSKKKYIYTSTETTFGVVAGGGIYSVQGYACSECYENENGCREKVCGSFRAIFSSLGVSAKLAILTGSKSIKKVVWKSKYERDYPTIYDFEGGASIITGGISAIFGISVQDITLGNVRNKSIGFNFPALDLSIVGGSGYCWIEPGSIIKISCGSKK